MIMIIICVFRVEKKMKKESKNRDDLGIRNAKKRRGLVQNVVQFQLKGRALSNSAMANLRWFRG